MSEAESKAFQYAILRCVPSIERGECLNVGVLLFCRELGFLGARVHVDERRLAAFAPGVDAGELRRHLDALAAVAAGDADAGPLAALSASERFGSLSAPSSTVIQPSAVHTGMCDEPAAMLEHLFERLVLLG